MDREDDGLSVAVLLCGPLRTFEQTAPTLLRYVVCNPAVKLFYFGPAETDNPTTDYGGELSVLGAFKRNPKSGVNPTLPADIGGLQRAYGDRLTGFAFHDHPQSAFFAAAERVIARDSWLMGLNPYRMISMAHNIEGGLRLMLNYERENGLHFDVVVITRPDLAFYAPISFAVKRGELHLPASEGFDAYGRPRRGNAAVFFYKNVSTGDFVPGGRTTTFNDQFMMLDRADAESFLSLGEALPGYLAAKVPPSPETVLYLHLVGRAGLTAISHPEWVYEIHRRGAPLVVSLADTPDINRVDRNHPAAIALRRGRPIYHALRDLRNFVRGLLHRALD
jgi:hypothetical protein